MIPESTESRVVLVTGAARRIGNSIARRFHSAGFLVVAHYRHSAAAADRLCEELNRQRQNSCLLMQGDIGSPAGRQKILQIIESIGRLDALVNNASLYFPTPIGEVTERDWKALFDSNLAGPFFLSQSLAPFLAKSGGSIVNVADRSARQAQKGYSAYSIAKGGNLSMTRALALELAPAVRVNSVAPGVILWPENDAALSADVKNKIVAEIPLGRLGDPKEIAETVFFLATSAHYMTGQTIAVDGGLSNCF